MKIAVDDLSGTEIARFLQEHVQQMRPITPLESKHALDLDSLRKPDITFWSVRDGNSLVGCGALKRLDAGHAELKPIRTRPSRISGPLLTARSGTGVARRLGLPLKGLALYPGAFARRVRARAVRSWHCCRERWLVLRGWAV
ncbi:GNAT family N-acetyltransferase [Streptomyces sp. NPDC002067]